MNRDVCGICWCPYDDNGACGCKSLDESMRLPRAMAQAYENGYKAGEAHERERCLRLIDDHVRAVDSEDVVRAIKEVQG